jgi:hypothetical protein
MGHETTVSSGRTVLTIVLTDVSISGMLQGASDLVSIVGSPPLLGLHGFSTKQFG